MRPKSARAKGRVGEHEFARIMGAKRMILSGAAGGGDLDERSLPSIWKDSFVWEIKRRAKLPNIATAPLAQAAFAARGTPKKPAAAYREDGGRWIVSFYAEDLVQFVSAVGETGMSWKIRDAAGHIESLAQDIKAFARGQS